jgi:N-acetylglucosaminyldiphosphoundecaprenol N-acetyl-beta-D-mannosaminyltransferase
VPVVMGVGATIDFLAGQVKRAPRWMQRCGAEWLYRLSQEPRRLFSRYTRDLWFFSWELSQQLRLMELSRWRRRQEIRAQHGKDRPVMWTRLQADGADWECIAAPQCLDRRAVHRGEQFWREPPAKHCALGVAEVRFIDSTGVALLLRLQNRFHAAQKQFVLLCPSHAVRRALHVLRVESFLPAVGRESPTTTPSLPGKLA